MEVFNLVLLAYIVVMIVDISGVVDSIKSGLKWLLTKGRMNSCDYRLKPLDCSLCMIFWVGIAYLFIHGLFGIGYVCLVLLLACLAEVIKSSILLVKDLFTSIINWLYKYID